MPADLSFCHDATAFLRRSYRGRFAGRAFIRFHNSELLPAQRYHIFRHLSLRFAPLSQGSRLRSVEIFHICRYPHRAGYPDSLNRPVLAGHDDYYSNCLRLYTAQGFLHSQIRPEATVQQSGRDGGYCSGHRLHLADSQLQRSWRTDAGFHQRRGTGQYRQPDYRPTGETAV